MRDQSILFCFFVLMLASRVNASTMRADALQTEREQKTFKFCLYGAAEDKFDHELNLKISNLGMEDYVHLEETQSFLFYRVQTSKKKPKKKSLEIALTFVSSENSIDYYSKKKPILRLFMPDKLQDRAIRILFNGRNRFLSEIQMFIRSPFECKVGEHKGRAMSSFKLVHENFRKSRISKLEAKLKANHSVSWRCNDQKDQPILHLKGSSEIYFDLKDAQAEVINFKLGYSITQKPLEGSAIGASN